MKVPFQNAEKIVPRLPPGDLNSLPGTEINFTRRQDKHKTTFPVEALPYLQAFINGKSIQALITERRDQGLQVDFKEIKQTLLTLYWSHNILNAHEFRKFIEFSDWVPVNDSRLLKPFFEISLENLTPLSQILIYSVSVALVFLAIRLLSFEETQALALLFLPQAFLTAKGILSRALSAQLNTSPQSLNLHISPLGFYLKESSARRTPIHWGEYLLHTAVLAALDLIVLWGCAHANDILCRQSGPLILLLLNCLLLSPSHKTDLSDFYLTLEKDLNPKTSKHSWTFISSMVFTSSVSVLLLISMAFSIFTLTEISNLVQHWNFLNAIPAVLSSLAFLGLIFDLIDDFDFMIDHVQGRFVSPLKSFFSGLKPAKNKIQAIDLLNSIPIFQSLPDVVRREMARSSRIVGLRAGITVCKEGQKTTDLYVIIEGNVGIYKNQEDGRKARILTVGSGSIFGEGGFFLERPRSGDAVTLTPATILCIKRPTSLENASKVPGALASKFQRKIWAFQALANSKFFKEVPPELAMQIINRGEIVEIDRDQCLMRQNDLPDALWVIVEGSCRAVMSGNFQRDMGPGDVIGEIGIIWNSRRTSTVHATSPTILLRVNATEIWPIFSNCLNLGVTLQELGIERLQSQAA